MNPLTQAILDALRELDDKLLAGVYGIGRTGQGRPIPADEMPSLDAAILAWRAAGCPDAGAE